MTQKKYVERNRFTLPNWVRIGCLFLVLFFSYPFQVSSASAKQSVFLQEIQVACKYRNPTNSHAFSGFKTNATKKQIGLLITTDFKKQLAFLQQRMMVQFKSIAFHFICSKAMIKAHLLQEPLFHPNEAETQSAIV